MVRGRVVLMGVLSYLYKTKNAFACVRNSVKIKENATTYLTNNKKDAMIVLWKIQAKSTAK